MDGIQTAAPQQDPWAALGGMPEMPPPAAPASPASPELRRGGQDPWAGLGGIPDEQAPSPARPVATPPELEAAASHFAPQPPRPPASFETPFPARTRTGAVNPLAVEEQQAQGQIEGWMPRGGHAEELGNNPVFRPGDQPALQQPIAQPYPVVPTRPVGAAPPAPPQPAGAPAGTTVAPPTSYDAGPLAGQPIPGMIQKGNIDVNHRPSIANADGSHSSIFSVTIPLGADGKPWTGDYGKAPRYALVPSIADGRFLTPDAKIPALAQADDSKLTPAQQKEKKGQLEALTDAATRQYAKTGQHLGIFASGDAADQYAGHTHAWMNDGTGRQVFAPSYAPPGTTVAPPTATVEPWTPSWTDRFHSLLRNSPLGHAIQTEFGSAAPESPMGKVVEWMRPTTQQGSEQYQAEQQGPRFEELTRGLTRQQAQEGANAIRILSAIPTSGASLLPQRPLAPGTFRETVAAPETPMQQKVTGAAKATSEFLSAPSIATQVAIAAGSGGLGEILAAPMVPEVAAKVVRSLIGAGFTGQMAAQSVQDLIQYHKDKTQAAAARAAGNTAQADALDRQANETIGGLGINGTLAILAGLGTAAEAHGAAHAAREWRRLGGVPEPAVEPPFKDVRLAGQWQDLGGEPEAAANLPRGTPPTPTEPAAGEKPILHGTNDVEVLRASAKRQAGELGDQVAAATEGVPGAEVEAVRSAKDTDRIEDKAARQGIQPSQVGDIAAAKLSVPDQQIADQVLANLNRSGLPVEERNGTVTGEPGKNNVRQTQAIVNLGKPGEAVQRAEVLLQTPEMAKVTEETHDDYRRAQELRAAGKEEEARTLEAEIGRQHEEAEQAAQQRLAGAPPAGEGGRGQPPERKVELVAAAPAAATAEPKFKFGSTQANMPADSEAAQSVRQVQQRIAPEDRAGDVNDAKGGIVEQPHVTVRYGIQGEDTEGIRRYLEQQAPFEATLGKTEKFPVTKSSEGTAPIVAAIEAPELNRIERELEKHGDFAARTFPEYKPHTTVAYVKPEAADKYVGLNETEGKGFRVNSIAISDRNGNQIDVPLRGEPNAIRERGAGGVRERPPQEAGGAGNGRGRVEPGVEGAQAAGTQPQERAAGAEAAGPREVTGPARGFVPGAYSRMQVADIGVDPRRFQYKMDVDTAGVTGLLKGREWNPELAGALGVWRNPVDGKVYVVNGHHRLDLAKARGIPEVDVYGIKASDEQAARAWGALKNIASGRGTVLDAAKFFRDSGYTVDDLNRLGISLGEKHAVDGMALSRLDPSLFDEVVSGRMRPGRGVAIGSASAEPADQEALVKLIQRAEQKGRRVSDDVVDELARMVKGAGRATETQETLFGAQEMTHNLALEKADVSDYVRKQLGQERRTFAGVADQAKAAKLAKVEGQNIKASENAKIAREAAQQLELYDRLSTRGGKIDDILNQAAKELAGGKNANDVKARAYTAAREALAETLRTPTRGEYPGAGEQLEVGAGERQQRAIRPAAGGAPRRSSAEAGEWQRGDQFLVRDPASGKLLRGEVSYLGRSANNQRTVARARIGSQNIDLRDGIPPDAIRIDTQGIKQPKPKTYDQEEQRIIDRTMAYLPKLVGDTIEEYSRDGVPTVAVDAIKEMFPEFKADKVRNDRLVASSAVAVRDGMLKTLLGTPVDPERPNVLLATGSPGAGKTSGQALGRIAPSIGIQIEAVSDDFGNTEKLVKQILDSGRRPVLTWTYVDSPGETVERMFRRAIGHEGVPGIGRTVQLSYMKDAYYKVPRVIRGIMEELGDKVSVIGIDNSGPRGTAKLMDSVHPYLDEAHEYSYNEVGREMDDATRRLEAQGAFNSQHGRAILEAAQATDRGAEAAARAGEGEGRAAPAGAGGAGPVEQPAIPGEPQAPSPVLAAGKQEIEGRGQPAAPRGVSDEEFASSLTEARARSLRENVAAHKVSVVDGDAGRAVILDADGYALWHRLGLGEKVAWRGVNLSPRAANRVEILLRGLAGSARTEPGGAEAAAGYDRLVQMLQKGRNDDGSVTLARGDYRPDTLREEAWHRWWRRYNLDESEAARAIAQGPEIREVADRLRDLGYGAQPGIEGRTELAAEMMAKALAGDPALEMTPEQRNDLVNRFLMEAARESGPTIFDNLPPVAPEAEAAVEEARRAYEAESNAGRGGPAARGQRPGRGAQGDEGAGRGGLPLPARGERAPGQGNEPGIQKGGQAAAELAQRARPTPVRPEDSLALPGMEGTDQERTRALGEAEAARMSEEMRTPLGSINKAAGEMERNAPLFHGTGENPDLFSQAERPGEGTGKLFDDKGDYPSLFQRDQEDTPAFKAWFRESKVKEGEGRPQVLYHVTPNDFTVFQTEPREIGEGHLGADSIGSWFAGNKDLATAVYDHYIKNAGKGEAPGPDFRPRTMPVYASIEHPLEVTDRAGLEDALMEVAAKAERERRGLPPAISVDRNDYETYAEYQEAAAKAVERNQRPDEKQFRDWLYKMWNFQDDDIDAARAVKDTLLSAGYDGVHVSNDHRFGDAWIAFKPEQIKSAIGNVGTFSRTEPDILYQRNKEGEPTARSVADLVEDLRKMPATGPTGVDAVSAMLRREAEESMGRATRWWRKAPGVERGMAQANAVVAALSHDVADATAERTTALFKAAAAGLVRTAKIPVDLYSKAGLPIPNDFKASIGEMNEAKTALATAMRDFGREINRVAPDRVTQSAMKYWIEAGGDPKKLSSWAATAKTRADLAEDNPAFSRRLRGFYRDSVAHYEAAAKLSDEQRAIAQRLKEHFDDMLDQMTTNGILHQGLRDYVTHLYEKGPESANMARMIALDEVSPNPYFTNPRSFRDYLDAENHGMIPRDGRIGYLAAAYDKAAGEGLASRAFIRRLLYGKTGDELTPTGRQPLAIMQSVGRWVIAKDNEMPSVLQRREQPTDLNLRDYKEFPDLPQTRGFLFEPTAEDLDTFKHDPRLFEEDPKKVVFKGNILFHKSIAPVVEDLLRPGWFDRNQTRMQKVGHFALQVNALSKELMTSLIPAPFHMVNIGRRVMEHGVSPFTLPAIDMSDPDQAFAVRCGLDPLHADAEGLFSAKVMKGLFEGIPVLNYVADRTHSFSQWMFQDWIPRAGMSLWKSAMETNTHLYGPDLEDAAYKRMRAEVEGTDPEVRRAAKDFARRQLGEMSARQANASVGVMNTYFDSIPRSRTAKQALRLVFFAPTFFESTGRYVAQATTRRGFEQSTALLRGVGTVYLLARGLNAAFNNGNTYWDDPSMALAVKVGPKVYRLRGALEDMFHILTNPKQAAMNRLSAPFSGTLEFLSGRDYSGKQRTIPHRVEDSLRRTAPFQVQKILTTPDMKWYDSVLSASGVYGSTYRDKTAQSIHDLYVANIPDMPDDEERQAESRQNYQLEDDLRNGKIKSSDLLEMAREGKIRIHAAGNIIRRAQHPRFVNEFSSPGVGIKDALDIYDKAKPDERLDLRAALERKGQNKIPELPEDQRAAVETRWKKLLAATPTGEEPEPTSAPGQAPPAQAAR